MVGLDLSPFLLGVETVRGRELLRRMRLRQKEGVMTNLGLSDWPDPLGLVGPRSFGLKLSFGIMGHPACRLVDALRHPGIIAPTSLSLTNH